MEKKEEHKVFANNTFDLVRYIWKKRNLLMVLSAVGFGASVIISLLITPRFKSGVVLFPTADVSLSKSLMETSTFNTEFRDVLSFGEDEEAERMLQILHSNQIKDHIVKKYDLMKHYRINPSGSYPYTKLENKYKGNIKFRRTEFNSIEIEVLDANADTAALIANEIAGYIDSTIHNIQKDRAIEAFKIVEKEYRKTQNDIETINDSLQKIRHLGVIDYESQAAALNNAYTEALSVGNQNAMASIQKRMNTLSVYGGTYIELSKKLEGEITRMGQLKEKYAACKVNVEQTLPHMFILDKATKAERKAVPKRSIIVIISTLSTFFLSLLILLIIDQIKAES
jgi:uncharacterized protein involved in exopolysaccharide biosynthesis